MSAIVLSLMLLGAAAEVQTRETPTTGLFVQTTPPDAAIKLDGKAEGTAPKVFVVPSGATKMIVEVQLDGHASQRREVTIQGGRVTRIEFLLEPAPPAKSGGARKSLEPAGLDAPRAVVSDRDPKALHEMAVQRAQAVMHAAKAEYDLVLEANKKDPGTVSELDILRLRADLNLAEIDLRRAVVGDRDPKARHDIGVQRAQAVVQAAEQAAAEFARVEKLFKKGYVTQSKYDRAKRELDQARAAAEEVTTSVAGHGTRPAPTDAGKVAQSTESAKREPLLKERRDTLRQQLETTDKRYNEGNAALASVLRVADQLLEAELELAATKPERITLCEKLIADLRKKEAQVKARIEAGAKGAAGVSAGEELLEAKAARLKLEAKLSQERAAGK